MKAISPAPQFLSSVESNKGLEQPVVENTSGTNDHWLISPPTPGRFNQGAVVDSTTKKDNSNKTANKTLSPLPEDLTNYIISLPTKKMRERAKGCLKGLLEKFSAEDIDLGVKHLLSEGLPGNGQECHSPLSYLESAAPSVFAEIGKTKRLIREPELALLDIATDEPQIAKKEVHDIREVKKKFEVENSQEQQAEIITKYQARKEIFSGLKKETLKNLAILDWYESSYC
jgi:predicted DNA-binding protein YlxM (UPF0122 family)